ncbi:MAG: succinate dehydrogenase cytochrome b-556 subunit [Rickettsiaceae bacterium]|jgi:succinate dehydrogenase / fumarate reductase cytochrome b subunit|nr:succinate dehydrogenase cytochrome b-556 subunit [Rickettsiaceae bacterium]
MSKKNEIYSRRPTSPHLSIYRWQISNSLSILHRLTGIGLFASLSLLAWWGILVVFSSNCYCLISLADTIYFKAIILLSAYALFFHLTTGIRHLFWDIGYGYSIRTMHITGWLTVLSSFSLTAMLYYHVLS